MARQVHTPIQLLGPFPVPLALAAVTQKTAVAGIAADKEEVQLTGKEIVHIRNSGATGRLVTFTSAADAQGRTGDVSDTIAAGKDAFYGPFSINGWQQSGGKLHFEVAHAECLITVLRLP